MHMLYELSWTPLPYPTPPPPPQKDADNREYLKQLVRTHSQPEELNMGVCSKTW
jgi:hypothetical protein